MKSSSCHVGRLAKANPASWRGLIALVFGIAMLWAGCATPVNQSLSFKEDDFQPYQASGTAIISGHAFARSDTGVKRGAAGLKISLVPLTDYTEERARIMESRKEPTPADPRLDKYLKTTVGELGGGFAFAGLPAGRYLVYCKIEWEAKFAGSMRRDGSGSFYVIARATVTDGEHKNVVVTNLDQK